MFQSNLGGVHNDVLSACPEGEDSKIRLVEEIKNRAKCSIGVRNYPEAIELYNKAIEISPNDAVLKANRSMCHLNMGASANALNDAVDAIELDKNYAKGYYRKGAAQLAMKDYAGAVESFSAGLMLVPNDKDLKQQLDKAQKLQQSNGQPVVSVPTTVPKKSSETILTKKDRTDSHTTETEEEDTAETGQAPIRGYKKTSDGKVTTFFNHELDDQTKALIGNIAPKKLDPSTSATAFPTQTPAGTNGSVWNAAGTWEERVHTPWAVKRLRELVESLGELTVPDTDVGGTVVVRITKVLSVDGDAQVTSARGKRKHIYDLKIELEWEVNLRLQEDEVLAKGKTIVVDITGDEDFEFLHEVDKTFTGGSVSSSSHQLTLSSPLIKGCMASIKKSLLTSFQAFKTEFLAI